MTPVSVTFDDGDQPASTVTGNLLAFNDFHGNIDPPTGSGGLVNGVPGRRRGVPGVLGQEAARRGQAAGSDKVITVAAGDNVGASPLVSAAFHDEPRSRSRTRSAWTSPRSATTSSTRASPSSSGCSSAAATRSTAARTATASPARSSRILAANVTDKQTKLPILLPFTIKFVGGVPVGVRRHDAQGHPDDREPGRHHHGRLPGRGRDGQLLRQAARPASASSRWCCVIHEGGSQSAPTVVRPVDAAPTSPARSRRSWPGCGPTYGVVVSGHTHQWYSCALPNSSGAELGGHQRRLGRPAGHRHPMTLDKRTRRFVSASAHNTIVENGIRNPDGTCQTSATARSCGTRPRSTRRPR